MQLVINTCYGGFSLSPLGLKRYCELQGKDCFFFIKKDLLNGEYEQISIDKIGNTSFWTAFSVDNPNEYLEQTKRWTEMTIEERKAHNLKYREIDCNSRSEDRADPLLVQTVNELGEKANGRFADLKIVEIPDGVDWTIEEYDGQEWVAEKHETWA